MTIRFPRCLFPITVFSLVCSVGLSASVVSTCWGQAATESNEPSTKTEPTSTKPTKSELIDTLNTVFTLLEKEDYSGASEHFVLPPNFKPEMLNGFIQRSEISQAGIDVLKSDATFAAATQTFGADRAASHAKRADVDVAQCYGFYHETDEATGEVMALWEGTKFKLMRLDDVGKLTASSVTQPDANESVDETMKQLSTLDSQLIANQPMLKPAVDLAAIAQRLPALESATNENPLDVGARANYAMALYQIGNFPLAWTQLRVAGKLDPKHAGVAKGMTALFAKFETLGVFTVGVPPETVTGLMGEPDEVVELSETRKRYVYSFFGLDFADGRLHEVIDLRGATEAMFQPKEIVSVDLDGRGWRCGSRKKADGQVTALYFVPGEMLSNWKEQVEVQRIPGAAGIGTMKVLTEKLVAQVLAVHPEMEHQILDMQEDSAIIALEFPAGFEFDKRHQLVRLFKGELDVHRLAYTLKVDQPTKETQMKWLAIMKAAKLEAVKK